MSLFFRWFVKELWHVVIEFDVWTKLSISQTWIILDWFQRKAVGNILRNELFDQDLMLSLLVLQLIDKVLSFVGCV